jgi:hypothetical protein
MSFRACVEQVLVPTLNPGDVVTMDNLESHKGRGVRQAIRAGASYSSCRRTRRTSTQSNRCSPK